MDNVVQFPGADKLHTHGDGTVHHHPEATGCAGGCGGGVDHECCGGAGHADPNHVCGCAKPEKKVVTSIHLESRSDKHCAYVLLIDGARSFDIVVDKEASGIVVTLNSGKDVPSDIKGMCENETHKYESIPATQYVEFYDEDENLIPEEIARVLSSALRSGIVESVEGHVLDDGCVQRMISFEDGNYSIVTMPGFDHKNSFACSCVGEDGFYSMAGLT